jgi:Transposase and inactivated derivatives
MDQDTLRFLLREAVRETVTEVLQTVLELDRTAFLQAHGGRRNGYYPRRLETTFGQVDLKVPRDREGQYYPAFRRRPLPEEMAFVYLDGLYLKLLREGEGVVREVVYYPFMLSPSS